MRPAAGISGRPADHQLLADELEGKAGRAHIRKGLGRRVEQDHTAADMAGLLEVCLQIGGGKIMDIERHDGTKERREYGSVKEMMDDAERLVRDPSVKKITLWPRLSIPKKRGRR
jgi:hypothetical protein